MRNCWPVVGKRWSGRGGREGVWRVRNGNEEPDISIQHQLLGDAYI